MSNNQLDHIAEIIRIRTLTRRDVDRHKMRRTVDDLMSGLARLNDLSQRIVLADNVDDDIATPTNDFFYTLWNIESDINALHRLLPHITIADVDDVYEQPTSYVA